ncbi:zinc-finger domain-containing protein [Bacillus sp. S/N-304-OC-R1]|uniref:zinc-finger domain-containing protein n=1 Tax=Bacillus sp. S/N-304-OC-R1 TaxID=2758034 RepID=UPI001C8D3CC9|nr:zinc-finger domain-containing protein [Bacillus sp. S/N-304-OC-R1]MBY0122666.1 zinc-finger domain-containing protein [Bacillus sp. S/N-304-OC-R1]
MNRKQLYDEVEELLNTYCQGCLLHKLHKDEKGRTYAHKFCITDCTVGEKIKLIGSKLTQNNE